MTYNTTSPTFKTMKISRMDQLIRKMSCCVPTFSTILTCYLRACLQVAERGFVIWKPYCKYFIMTILCKLYLVYQGIREHLKQDHNFQLRDEVNDITEIDKFSDVWRSIFPNHQGAIPHPCE